MLGALVTVAVLAILAGWAIEVRVHRDGSGGARDLIRVYGSAEAVIAAAAAGPLDATITRAARVRQLVLAGVADIRLSRALARLRENIPI